jgi:hypothetical protein
MNPTTRSIIEPGQDARACSLAGVCITSPACAHQGTARLPRPGQARSYLGSRAWRNIVELGGTSLRPAPALTRRRHRPAVARKIDVCTADSFSIAEDFGVISTKTLRNATRLRDYRENSPRSAREGSGRRQSSVRHATLLRDHRPTAASPRRSSSQRGNLPRPAQRTTRTPHCPERPGPARRQPHHPGPLTPR